MCCVTSRKRPSGVRPKMDMCGRLLCRITKNTEIVRLCGAGE